MAFKVLRVVQRSDDALKYQDQTAVVVATGFDSEIEAIRYASLKDQESFLFCRERFPFTYHTTIEGGKK